jgi:hypothetical protein
LQVYDPILGDLVPDSGPPRTGVVEWPGGRLVPRQELNNIEALTREALEDGDALVELQASDMARLLQHVAVLEWQIRELDGEFCEACGCTEQAPCVHADGYSCGWASQEPLICTACAEEGLPPCGASTEGPWGEPVVCSLHEGHGGDHKDRAANTSWPAVPHG